MKKALALLLCLLMVLSLAACGGGGTKPADDGAKPADTTPADDGAKPADTTPADDKGEEPAPAADTGRDTVRIAVDGDCGSLDPYIVSGAVI